MPAATTFTIASAGAGLGPHSPQIKGRNITPPWLPPRAKDTIASSASSGTTPGR